MSGAILRGSAEQPPLQEDLALLGVDGPVALVTAGWEEAERNDAAIDRSLGGGTRNLGLYGRRLDILETDAEYASAELRFQQHVTEMQAVYRIRLEAALGAVQALRRRDASARRRLGTDVDEALAHVRALDDAHLMRLREVHAVELAAAAEASDAVLTHRAAVAEILNGCAALAIAGGHAGVLIACLDLCGLGAACAALPVIAWSSGCMALAERVVVMDDRDIAGRAPEVVGEGMGAVRGVISFPDAAERMQSGDDDRALLARRFAPRACVLLDRGDRVMCEGGEADLAGARVLQPDGTVQSTAEAA